MYPRWASNAGLATRFAPRYLRPPLLACHVPLLSNIRALVLWEGHIGQHDNASSTKLSASTAAVLRAFYSEDQRQLQEALTTSAVLKSFYPQDQRLLQEALAQP